MYQAVLPASLTEKKKSLVNIYVSLVYLQSILPLRVTDGFETVLELDCVKLEVSFAF